MSDTNPRRADGTRSAHPSSPTRISPAGRALLAVVVAAVSERLAALDREIRDLSMSQDDPVDVERALVLAGQAILSDVLLPDGVEAFLRGASRRALRGAVALRVASVLSAVGDAPRDEKAAETREGQRALAAARIFCARAGHAGDSTEIGVLDEALSLLAEDRRDRCGLSVPLL